MVNLKKLKEMLNIKEISKATKASYVQKATSDIFKRGSDMSTAVSKGDHYAAGKETKKATKRATTINKLIHKGLYNKEEKLDELSPETLKKYKAAVDKKHTVKDYDPSKGVNRYTSKGIQRFKSHDQERKRDTGVARANDRLKKEDVEIEESMLKNPYKGMDKDKLQAKHKSFNRQIADLQHKKMRSNMGAGGSGFDSEISKYKTKLQHVKNAMKEAQCDCEDNCDCNEKDVKEQKPCWDGYKQVGTKMKNGREVPNCVPEETEMQVERKIEVSEPEENKLKKIVKSLHKSVKSHGDQAKSIEKSIIDKQSVSEISTDTKKMYIQKATKDIANRGMDRGMAMSRDGDQADQQAKAADKVIKKRQKGITKAVKSMTKNEALEIGTDEIANVYKAMTPGQEPSNQYRSVASVYRNMVKKRTEIERVARSKKTDVAGSRGDQQQNS